LKSDNLQEWTKEELIRAVLQLRRENSSLQQGIARFLTGNSRLNGIPVPPAPVVPTPRKTPDLTVWGGGDKKWFERMRHDRRIKG
jgi:hypothetical protein